MVMLLCWRLLTVLIVLAARAQASNNTKRCKLLTESPNEQKALSLLEPLTNQNFTAKSDNNQESYTFVFQVCGDADGMKDAGVVQRDKKGIQIRIGNYTSAQAIGGSDWVMLIYGGGQNYQGHCSQESRKAIILISCDRSQTAGTLSVVLEDRDKISNCFYLLEMDSKAVCPVLESRLSSGSILLIVCLSCLVVYIIGGVLYQRLVVGAKGVDQFPNYGFWTEIGNLSADGCDFVCRSRGNRAEPATYRGVTAEPLEEPEERDDHLLPM